jgi:antitoxin (DNA-binding transcriptional repressor) of toxin-antitoxin stability system
VSHRYNAGMNTIRIEDIQRDPLPYLRRVEAGETLVIVRADTPIAEIKPIAASGKPQRPFGLCAGEFTVPGDFDQPLPEDVLRQFEGS